MAHSIHVGFLSVDDFAARIIDAVAQKNIVCEKDIYVSDKNPTHLEAYSKHKINVLADDISVLMKSEIVVIAATKREFGTVLAPITALTRGKIIIIMTAGIDCDYVLDRVTRGTLFASAMPTQNEDGTWTEHLAYSAGFPEYMKTACSDIVKSVCI